MTSAEPALRSDVEPGVAELEQQLALDADAVADDTAARAVARRPRRTRRKPVRRLLVVSHRWLSIVLGLVLLVEAMSGVVLLYKPELHHALNGQAFEHSTGATTVSMGQAVEAVERAHPDYAPVAVVDANGVYAVTDYETAWNVDKHTGAVLGHVDEPPTWLSWLENLHECALGCEGMPGYVATLNKEAPHSTWLRYDDYPVTWAAVILGLLGLLLLYLTLTGLWLWFPRPSRWRTGFTVRWRKGRFARDTDLHKLLGMVALVPLLMWAVTGVGFELGPARDAWDAVTPGKRVEDPVTVIEGSAEPRQRPLTIDEATAVAQRAVPGAHVVTVSVPPEGDTRQKYDFWLDSGHDPYSHTDYPGDVEVAVGPNRGSAAIEYGFPDQPTSQTIWDLWSYPVHSGYVVTGWWRTIWLVLGLAPLLLGVTGLSTWLFRLRTRRRRARARRSSMASTPPSAQPQK